VNENHAGGWLMNWKDVLRENFMQLAAVFSAF
jgi:hypothetical protein